MVSLFVHLIILANTKDREFEGRTIRRGQLLTSLRSLSEKTGITIQSLRTSLAHLEKTQEITRESTRQGTLITICKYADYQDRETPANTPSNNQPTHDQHTTNTQPTQTLDSKIDIDIKDCCCSSNAPATAREGEGFSFWSLPEDQQQQEQQDFFEIFFFGNFRNVPGEVKRFIATNEGHRWLNKGKTECYATPGQRRAIAQLWRPQSNKPRVASSAFLAMWRDLYALAKKSDPAVAALMLDERVTVGEVGDGRMFFIAHQVVWEWITDKSRAEMTRKIIDRFTKKMVTVKYII